MEEKEEPKKGWFRIVVESIGDVLEAIIEIFIRGIGFILESIADSLSDL